MSEVKASLFISYSHDDILLVTELIKLLRRHYRSENVWYDDELKRFGGQDWWDLICENIRISNIFLFCVSNDALKSEVCERELTEAKKLGKAILPVIVRPRTELPEYIAQKEYIDISQGITPNNLTDIYSSIATLLAISRHIPARSLDPLTRGESGNVSIDPAIEIAQTDFTPLRVIAGPGTGKTTALMGRVARLVNQGVNPKRILAVTFTRAAALDIKNSLEKIDLSGHGSIISGTLHSICLLMLKNSGLDTLKRMERILKKYEVRFMLQDLKIEPRFGDYNKRKRRLNAFEATWAIEPNQLPGWPSDEIDRRFQDLLYAWLYFHDAGLMSEIIPETFKYLRNNPECAELRLFDHILVDEYQDLSKAEQVIFDLMSKNASLVAVGDIDQSIYEKMRYAYPLGILELETRHADKEINDVSIYLCQRCPTNIVQIANSLIRNNKARRQDYFVTPKAENGYGEIHVIQWQDMEAEARGIASFLRSRIEKNGITSQDILVLCPRLIMGNMIKDALKELGQLAQCFFREDILAGTPTQLLKHDAQEAFTLLKLLENSEDRVALRCWLGFGDNELRYKYYRKLQDLSAFNKVSPFVLLEMMVSNSPLIPYIKPLADRYIELKRRLSFEADTSDIDKFRTLFPLDAKWAEPFHDLIGNIDEGSDLSQIIEGIENYIIRPEIPPLSDTIRIMSLHSSKGLSARLVIVAGCIEGLIPGVFDPSEEISSYDETMHIEEQRRLFYVAITRSSETLVISSCVQMPLDLAYEMVIKVKPISKKIGITTASSFIAELGSTCPEPKSGSAWRY